VGKRRPRGVIGFDGPDQGTFEDYEGEQGVSKAKKKAYRLLSIKRGEKVKFQTMLKGEKKKAKICSKKGTGGCWGKRKGSGRDRNFIKKRNGANGSERRNSTVKIVRVSAQGHISAN